ncbi:MULTISPECIES: hypothetical protein [Halorussus]|uniref:hypothetical protein n=1 Tax=Halorussus TaxID=1070314 RepID=UPI0013B47674|nr:MULTISPECIES: hypothetical protein [Halorussus]NHN60643.1 hypothetical protein [Halorussus sp. JP-T4]
MVDAPQEPQENLDEELEEISDDLEDVNADIRDLIDQLRDRRAAPLRLAVRFSGDESDVLFIREDVREQYTDAELEERIETIVMKGLGDPPREEPLFDFGTLDATVRWYENVQVAHFPYREWSGLAFVFDRHESPIVDLAKRHLQDE